MPNSAVRTRQNDDLQPCADALVKVHATNGYPVEGVADPVGWLKPANLVASWVAELDGVVVGHVVVTEPNSSDDAANLYDGDGSPLVLGRLFVAPEARGCSLAEQLTRAVMEYAAESGRPLVLDVMDKDQAAIRLYERLGWRFLGTAEHDDGRGNKVSARCYAAPDD